MNATQLLNRAAEIMKQRADEYDQPTGERSMEKTVAAFNAITGRDLTEREGWEFMLVLKQVRLFQTDRHHQDSAEDAISYAALLAECSAETMK